MTGSKWNSEFWFLEILSVPRGEAEANIEIEGGQNLLFPLGQVVKRSKIEQKRLSIFSFQVFSYLLFSRHTTKAQEKSHLFFVSWRNKGDRKSVV